MVKAGLECPVFHPTAEDLNGPFEAYIEKIEKRAAKAGVAKIVAPRGWLARKEGYGEDLDFRIERCIKQVATGSRGLYRFLLLEQKPMSLRDDFKPLATAPENQPGTSEPAEIERKYWKNIALRPPLYGADVEGSLFDEDTKGWNLRRLDTVLSSVLNGAGHNLPGVTIPYLYFGMWKSTFAWHAEDLDLCSVNYLHFGAPKSWFVVPPEHQPRFKVVLEGMLPDLFRGCPEFLRHKELLVSTALLEQHQIPVIRVTQHPREFIVSFPGVFHAGFNHGYNCAESVNFATRRWIPFGARAKICQCNTDSVTIDMKLFRHLVPARLLPPELFMDVGGEDEGSDVEPPAAAPKDKTTPSAAKDKVTPSAAKDKATPSAAKDKATPSAAKEKNATAVPKGTRPNTPASAKKSTKTQKYISLTAASRGLVNCVCGGAVNSVSVGVKDAKPQGSTNSQNIAKAAAAAAKGTAAAGSGGGAAAAGAAGAKSAIGGSKDAKLQGSTKSPQSPKKAKAAVTAKGTAAAAGGGGAAAAPVKRIKIVTSAAHQQARVKLAQAEHDRTLEQQNLNGGSQDVAAAADPGPAADADAAASQTTAAAAAAAGSQAAPESDAVKTARATATTATATTAVAAMTMTAVAVEPPSVSHHDSVNISSPGPVAESLTVRVSLPAAVYGGLAVLSHTPPKSICCSSHTHGALAEGTTVELASSGKKNEPGLVKRSSEDVHMHSVPSTSPPVSVHMHSVPSTPPPLSPSPVGTSHPVGAQSSVVRILHPPALTSSSPPPKRVDFPTPAASMQLPPGCIASTSPVASMQLPPGHVASTAPAASMQLPPGHVASIAPAASMQLLPGPVASTAPSASMQLPSGHVASTALAASMQLPLGHVDSTAPAASAACSVHGATTSYPLHSPLHGSPVKPAADDAAATEGSCRLKRSRVPTFKALELKSATEVLRDTPSQSAASHKRHQASHGNSSTSAGQPTKTAAHPMGPAVPLVNGSTLSSHTAFKVPSPKAVQVALPNYSIAVAVKATPSGNMHVALRTLPKISLRQRPEKRIVKLSWKATDAIV